MIELRFITPDEWTSWRDCRLRALYEAPHAFGSRHADWKDAAEGQWRERLNLLGSINILAWKDGKPVGMASGVPASEEHTCELISMWVAPEGRGQGIGTLLIAAIEKWAREQGARELHLDVFEDNVPAIDLYTRNGFLDGGPSDETRERKMLKHLDGVLRR